MNILKFKTTFNFSKVFVGAVLFAAIGATSCDSTGDEPDQSELHTCRFVLNAEKPNFDKTRAESSSWKEGDKIYLRFSVGSNITPGMAVYKSGAWSVNFYGDLKEGSDIACTAVHFENPKSVTDSDVVLGDSTIVYEAPSSVYTYDGSVLTVTATLNPKSGRIRFKGKAGDKIEVKGIERNTNYSITANAYTNTTEAKTLTVASDGYTPYVYGKFDEADTPYLAIEATDAFYIRDFSKTIYQSGDSGYIIIPTKDARNGWLYNEKKEVTVKGVTIPLMKVVNSDGSIFYLMQTELTTGQYNAITSTSSSADKTMPTKQTYDNFKSMISTLNQLTNLKFRIPTKDEWVYASKGGMNSRGFTYSGSKTLSSVAWYASNSSSKLHEGKLLRPNELGFYDMNGNMKEFIESYYYSSYYYLSYMGGGYGSTPTSYGYEQYDSSYYSSTISSYQSDSYYAQGIRLALDI